MKTSSNTEIFNKIYMRNYWLIGSGTGSIWPFNIPFISFLNNFLKGHADIKTVIDIGCGDWSTGKHYDLDGRKYIGCEVASVLIENLKKRYGGNNINFRLLDAIYDQIPEGDLAIVKDVLQHLSNKDVVIILNKLGKFKYVVIQNDICTGQQHNRDIENGKWRPIDITKPPFNRTEYILGKNYTEYLYHAVNLIRKLLGMPDLKKGIFSNSPPQPSIFPHQTRLYRR